MFFNIVFYSRLLAQSKPAQPIDYIKLVADRVISNSTLKLRATTNKPQQAFQQIETVDFGRSFNLTGGIAYAYTNFESDERNTISFQVSHTDGLKIWINDKVVYSNAGKKEPFVSEEERTWVLNEQFKADLKKGVNKVLIKCQGLNSRDWKFMLQPLLPAREEGDVTTGSEPLKFSLSSEVLITEDVSKISNWLILGPFKNSPDNTSAGMETVYPPEKELIFGKLYYSGDKQIAWELPKIELVTDVFNADALWGSLYDWNYHTAGLAWAIGNLGAYTHQRKYNDYLYHYCEFMLAIKPYIFHEKYEMNKLYSRFSRMLNTHLLDFSAAPALPFAYAVLTNPDLNNSSAYEVLLNQTKEYMLNEQLRLPDGTLARETPFKYTLWVDDMFMGIPFLLNMSSYAKTEKEKQLFLNDAAKQIILFYNRLYDPAVNLYRHAWYSEHPETKLPYWSRGNGWGIWAASEALLYLPKTHPLYKEILSIYRSHICGIVKCQNKTTGFYPNLLDDPTSFKETSGTAIFTMAIARGINNGWLDKNTYQGYAQKGWNALTSVISADGDVSDICMGTMCSEDKNYYRTRPIVENDSHGLLGLVFAGIEMQKLSSMEKNKK